MVPMAEKVIHKAKLGGREAHLSMQKMFFMKEAGIKAVRELAPRFK